MPNVLDFALEVKAVDAKQRIIEGYASAWSVDNGEDEFAPGAWKAWLSEHPLNEIQVPSETHNRRSQPLGMPIEIREDSRGLFTKTRIHKTNAGDDWLAIAAERQAAGAPLGMSVGYAPERFAFQTKSGRTVRTITQAALLEYSFTPIPMNDDATVTAVKARIATKAVAAMSAEERRSEVQEAINARTKAPLATAPGPYTYVIETYDDHVIVCDENDDYWSIPYAIGADGEATIGEPVEVERTWTPATKTHNAALELKAGRRYSAATASLLKERLASARKALDEIEADVIAATDSPAADSKSTANTNEATAGPFDLAIALAKARGGLYA